MEIKNKKEISLTKENIVNILQDYIRMMGMGSTGDKYSMDFIVKNEIRPGPYPQDGYDHYVFKGVKIVVTHDLENRTY